ncbi:hypothetical protein [Hyphomicrobium sp.]|uniref:hypothetical protein n=1 Tax=Hyphomicrobium sp. TaxID=82 RepID=UPI001DA7491C|nr:hypothetical protein [Hyphomicrobium sp.]MBY0559872.1 hypothetical protein [Hyphomicrobium sp.]
MPLPSNEPKPIRQTYVVTEDGFVYGSWAKRGKTFALYPIQAEHFVQSGRMALATSADVPSKPVKPATNIAAPDADKKRSISSANDPG